MQPFARDDDVQHEGESLEQVVKRVSCRHGSDCSGEGVMLPSLLVDEPSVLSLEGRESLTGLLPWQGGLLCSEDSGTLPCRQPCMWPHTAVGSTLCCAQTDLCDVGLQASACIHGVAMQVHVKPALMCCSLPSA